MKSPMKVGQALQHAKFGVGIATSSDASRTVIDFYDHGVKTFVTDMLECELIAHAPARPEGSRPPRAKKASARK